MMHMGRSRETVSVLFFALDSLVTPGARSVPFASRRTNRYTYGVATKTKKESVDLMTTVSRAFEKRLSPRRRTRPFGNAWFAIWRRFPH